MLHFLDLLAVCLLLSVARGLPGPQANATTSNGTVATVTSTLTATVVVHPSTISSVSTLPTTTEASAISPITEASSISPTTTEPPSTVSSTSTCTEPLTQPTSWLTMTAARSGSPIHLLSVNAAGLSFYLGGSTISYCPDQVMAAGDCPPGNTTVILPCSMGSLVPGGQRLYVTPSGELGYTQPHSSQLPPGAVTCPFTYTKAPGAFIGRLEFGIGAPFGITGFMACPTENDGIYQVLGNLKNATVPMGNISQCLGFDALASDAPGIGAWEYT